MTAQRGERVECRGDADCPATEHIYGCFAEEREHLVYVDPNGEPDECTEECPGCHWEGNADCEAIRGGCDICDPDGELYRAQALAQQAAEDAEMPCPHGGPMRNCVNPDGAR